MLRVNQDNERLMEEYERIASDLLEWIAKTRPWLEARKSDNNLLGAQKRLEEFRRYRQREKPPRVEQKALLETNFNTLQTKLRLNNRPAYVPSVGREMVAIVEAWRGLQTAERGFEEWLLSEMMRLERLEHLAKKFHLKCAAHEQWSQGKEIMLGAQDFRSSRLNELRAIRKKHEAFESDLRAHEARIKSDKADRMAIYKNVAGAVLGKGSILYLYHRSVIIAHTAKLHGFKPNPDGLVRVVGLTME